MRVLLDTQVWLWMLAAPDRLSSQSRALLVAAENELLLSAASAWEIAIKHGLGKLQLPESPAKYIPRMVVHTSVTPLPIHHRHALHVAELPEHHRDPFDRLLVAQAQVEGVPIMSADRHFRQYDVEVLPA
ncbi:MAG: type II toxin-antitoxin system VapC family toxin [Gemmatimonadales bacterium]|nr:type II toxin-antitoxin system VapC family toxin [Gemmatimonadales bacterium]MDZ4388141.1 type II toxin-antitoxin system VapC family toxin [Gemmatimonadales bacterium]